VGWLADEFGPVRWSKRETQRDSTTSTRKDGE
jgi:hypothetical protein